MSSQKSSGQTKYANSNLNGVFAKSSSTAGGTAGGATINRYSGMLILQKRTRVTPGGKLAVPKPVNLPSIKKEHAGNDPTTQLVPAGGTAGGWNKPEETPPVSQPEISRPAALTAGSTWASQPRVAGAAWQPPPAPGTKVPVSTGDRGLNPEEYPSLAATAKPQSVPQPKPGVKSSYEQESRAWAEDERAPAAAYRPASGDWAGRDGDRFDDERYASERPTEYVGRGSWDQGYRDRPPPRYEYDPGYAAPRGPVDDDYDFTRGRSFGYDSYGPPPQGGPPHEPPPPPPRRSIPLGEKYPEQVDRPEKLEAGRFDTFEVRSLFPPPPPPRQPPPPPRETATSEQSDEEDPERAAFEAELERVTAEMKRKAESQDAATVEKVPEKVQEVATSEEPEELSQEEGSAGHSDTESQKHDKGSMVPPPPPKPKLSRSALKEAEEEEERRRKEAAAEKLRRLEEEIAARAAARQQLDSVRAVCQAEEGTEGSDWEDDKAAVVECLVTRGNEEEEEDRQSADAPVLMPAPPPPPPVQPVESAVPKHMVNVWQPPSGMPLTARFGSFDEGLLEELTRSSSEEPAVRVGGWSHEPIGPSPLSHMVVPPPPPPPPPQAPKVLPNDVTQDAVVPPPTQKENLLSRSAESAAAAAIQAAESSLERRSREARTGRGAGRLGRGGRGAVAAVPAVESSKSGPLESRRSRERERSSKLPPTDLTGGGSEFGRGRGRGGRVAGRGRGARTAQGRRDENLSGQASPDTRGSSTPGEPSTEVDIVGEAVEVLDAGFIEVKSKRTMRQSRETAVPAPTSTVAPGPATEYRAPPVNKAPGRAERGSGGGALGSASAHKPPVPIAVETVKPPGLPGKLPTAVAARSAPQNIPGAASSASGSTNGGSFGWGAAIAKDVVNMTLDDPITSGGVNLPVSLDPTPPKPLGPIAETTFERQIGPARVQTNLPDSTLDVLGNGMPPLPADLNLDVLPSPPKSSNLGYPPVPVANIPMQNTMQNAMQNVMQNTIRPLGPGYFPRPDNNSNATGPASSLNMWAQHHPISFGQHPPGSIPHHQSQTSSNLQQAVESFYSAGPSMFPSNAPSIGVNSSTPASLQNTGPPPLMLNMNQFGQFQTFGPPFPPVGQYGSLGSAFFAQQPPFLPTGKQPDWSTGPGHSLNPALGPHALGRPTTLELGAMGPHGFSMQGPSVGDNQGFPGVSHPLVAPGGLPSLGPSTFPPPPKQGASLATPLKLLPGMAAPSISALSAQQVNPMAKDNLPKRTDLPDDIFPLETSASTSSSKPTPAESQMQLGNQNAPPPPPRGNQPPPPPPPARDGAAKGASAPRGGRTGGRVGRGGAASGSNTGNRLSAAAAAAAAAVDTAVGSAPGGGRGRGAARPLPAGIQGDRKGEASVSGDGTDKGAKQVLSRTASSDSRGSSSGGRGRSSVPRGGSGRGRRGGQSGVTMMYVPKGSVSAGAGGGPVDVSKNGQ